MSSGEAGHLIRRFVGSLSRRPPAPADVTWAVTWLEPAEAELWSAMSVADRRHSIEVARRFVDRTGGQPARSEIAAALLHDVGKTTADLGTFGRVGATLWCRAVGRDRASQGDGRISRYVRHEAIGADLLRAAGSSPRTIALVATKADEDDPAAQALAWADEI